MSQGAHTNVLIDDHCKCLFFDYTVFGRKNNNLTYAFICNMMYEYTQDSLLGARSSNPTRDRLNNFEPILTGTPGNGRTKAVNAAKPDHTATFAGKRTSTDSFATPGLTSSTTEGISATELVNMLGKAVSMGVQSGMKPKLGAKLEASMNKTEESPLHEGQTRADFWGFDGTTGAATMTENEIASKTRDYFSGDTDKQMQYKKVLSLKNEQLCQLLTFQVAQSFSEFAQDGCALRLLITEDKNTTFTTAIVAETITTLSHFLEDVLGSEYGIVRIALVDNIRSQMQSVNPKVYLDQAANAIRQLKHTTKLNEEAATALIRKFGERNLFDNSFMDNARIADARFTKGEVTRLTLAQAAATTKPNANGDEPASLRIPKKGKAGAKPTATAAITKDTKLDYSEMEGYCYSALKPGMKCNKKSCTLKHDGFTSLPESKQKSIIAAAKALSKQLAEIRKV